MDAIKTQRQISKESAVSCVSTTDAGSLLGSSFCGSSTTPSTSKSHLEVWNSDSETLIFFDWDDTLCPTTYIWDHPDLKWNEVAPCYANQSSGTSSETDMLRVLDAHQNAVISLLRFSATLGKVVILTLAEVGWVPTSCRNFMPLVMDVLEELQIETVYARRSLSNRFLAQAQEEENDLTKVLKTKSMSKIIKQFYDGGAKPRSWKNLISIGDSTAERSALQDNVFRHEQVDSHGVPKPCRCKVIKLRTKPSMELLTVQLQVLVSWLCSIVAQDDDVDIDFEDLDDDDDDLCC